MVNNAVAVHADLISLLGRGLLRRIPAWTTTAGSTTGDGVDAFEDCWCTT